MLEGRRVSRVLSQQQSSDGMPSLTINSTEFYSAPKNGGTTVRMWAKQFECGMRETDFESRGYYTLQRFGLPRIWSDASRDASPPFFQPTDTRNLKWCIKREPVERFVSGFSDKILHERLVTWTVDRCIELLESGEMQRMAAHDGPNRLAAIHFLPQCDWLGTNIGYYRHVFDINEMTRVHAFCQDHVFGVPLGRFHARNLSHAGVNKVSVTPLQRRRLEGIFAQDYRAGWC
jgi:hypothetical protein